MRREGRKRKGQVESWVELGSASMSAKMLLREMLL